MLVTRTCKPHVRDLINIYIVLYEVDTGFMVGTVGCMQTFLGSSLSAYSFFFP